MGATYLGWRIDRRDRDELLARFPPRYAHAIADHITFGKKDGAPPMPDADRVILVGRADDGRGVEAMVVEVAGTTARPTGGTYHITWSLAAGRHARESNDVIAGHTWQPLGEGAQARIERADWTT
jgi:hypothetical protein